MDTGLGNRGDEKSRGGGERHGSLGGWAGEGMQENVGRREGKEASRGTAPDGHAASCPAEDEADCTTELASAGVTACWEAEGAGSREDDGSAEAGIAPGVPRDKTDKTGWTWEGDGLATFVGDQSQVKTKGKV